jgi:hypothetical protein
MTKEGSKVSDKNLDDLWKKITSSDKKEAAAILRNLDDETINKLRTRKNPYKKPVFIGDKEKYLSFSIINVREKYYQRFAMTSLIGFIYRMLDEWKPKEIDEKYISEDDPRFANLYNEKVRAFSEKKPEELLLKEFEAVKKALADKGTWDNKDKDSETNIKSLIKQSFLVRFKIIKYRLYLLDKEITEKVAKCDILKRDLDRHKTEVASNKDVLISLRLKLEKRKKFEEDNLVRDKVKCFEELEDLEEEFIDELDELDELDDQPIANNNKGKNKEKEKEIEKIVNEVINKNTPKNTLTLNDVKATIESFEKRISNKEENIRILEEKIAKTEEEYNEKNNHLIKLKESIKDYQHRAENLKKEYDNKASVKIAKRKIHPLDEVEIQRYEPTSEELDLIANEVKLELGIERTAEEYTESVQAQIQSFLDDYLKYNPDNHVRCAYKPNYKDELRTPLEKTKKEDFDQDKVERLVIPPDDTFARWNRYMENNYEELRQATDDIYAEKSDIELAIVPLEVFEGNDKEQVDKEREKFERKYADEFDAEPFSAKFGVWNLMGPWAQNREIRNFYTEKSEIIKRILDQNREDVRAGQKLMKDRAKKKKDDNKKTDGPDSDALNQYLKSNPPTELQRHGAKPTSDIDTPDQIKAEDVPIDADISTKDQVEVDVHVIKPIRKGRRMRGYAEKFKFNIPAEEIPEGGMQVQTPPEHKKELMEKTAKANKKWKNRQK